MCIRYSLNWIEVLGVHYRPGLHVFMEFQRCLPVFGEIVKIVAVNEDFYLILELYKVIYFSSHYHAYVVQKTNLQHITSVVSLQDHHPLSLYQS